MLLVCCYLVFVLIWSWWYCICYVLCFVFGFVFCLFDVCLYFVWCRWFLWIYVFVVVGSLLVLFWCFRLLVPWLLWVLAIGLLRFNLTDCLCGGLVWRLILFWLLLLVGLLAYFVLLGNLFGWFGFLVSCVFGFGALCIGVYVCFSWFCLLIFVVYLCLFLALWRFDFVLLFIIWLLC